VGFFEWMGVNTDNHRLRKVSLEGGVPVTLCEAACPFGASWEPDDSIVFTTGALYGETGLAVVSAGGGEVRALTAPDKSKQQASHRLPHHLPDGRGVLFTIMDDIWDFEPQVAILDLKTRQWRILFENASDARYVLSGHILSYGKET